VPAIHQSDGLAGFSNPSYKVSSSLSLLLPAFPCSNWWELRFYC